MAFVSESITAAAGHSPDPLVKKDPGTITVELQDPENGPKGDLLPSRDRDAALNVYALNISQEQVDAVELKRLVRKIDLHLMPVMCWALTLFTMDKATLSYSSIMGIRKDLHLTSDQYAWVGSIFSIGYLGASIPCALIIQKAPLSKWVVITMTLWGTSLACVAAAKNYAQVMALRFLLGVLEASMTSTFVILTGMWYTRPEQAFRLGIWYSGLGLATLIGSPIAFGLAASNAHTGSLSSWQLLYIVFGVITVATAIVFFFLVPDNQLKARFLSPAERVAAVERIRVNQQGIGNKKLKMYQVKELLLDPRTYLYFAFQFVFNVGFGAISTYSSLLLVQLGFSNRDALIATVPHGATSMLAILGFGYLAYRFNDRTLWAGASCLGGFVAGACLYGLTNHKWAATCAFYFQHMATAAYILNFSLVSANTAGHTKKVLTNAVLLLGSTSGSLTGPQVTKNDVSYTKVKLVMWICPLCCCFIFAAVRFLNIWENKRRDQAQPERAQVEHREFLDLTDRENPDFRYQM